MSCAGYAIMLAWAAPHTIGAHGEYLVAKDGISEEESARQLRLLVGFAQFPGLQLYDQHKLNEVVAEVDAQSVSVRRPGSEVLYGPFAVFQWPEPTKAASLVPETPPTEMPTKAFERPPPGPLLRVRSSLLLESEDDGDSHVEVPEVESLIFSKTDNTYVHFKLLDLAKLTTLAIMGPQFRFTEQSMFHILYPKFFPNVDSNIWRPGTAVLLQFFTTSDGDFSLIIQPSLAETMSYLYASNIALIRVRTPNNAWDAHIVPFIRLLLFKLVCEEFASSRTWSTHLIRKQLELVSRPLLLRNIRFCILCMVLSAGVFHKHISLTKPAARNEVDTYAVGPELANSMRLRKIGINILNYHLDEYDNSSLHEENDGYEVLLLLALILQIHLDDSFGVFENYELIFAIGTFILENKPHTSRRQGPVEECLRQTFSMINIFYESTQAINFFNYSIPEIEQKQKYSDTNDNYDLGNETSLDESDGERTKKIKLASTSSKSHLSFTVYFNKRNSESDESSVRETEYRIPENRHISKPTLKVPKNPTLFEESVYLSFGIPKSLIQVFHEVIQLTNHKNVFRTRGITPRNFPKICAETEDRLINWNAESHWKLYDNKYNPISNVAEKEFLSDFHEGLYYNITSFHQALVVYYKRLIPGTPISASEAHIEACFTAMEKLLKLQATKDEKCSFSPSFWPILVCGCDIDVAKRPDLKERCQAMWNAKCFKRYNLWRVKQILFEIWTRRVELDESHSFMDMVREWDIFLCLG